MYTYNEVVCEYNIVHVCGEISVFSQLHAAKEMSPVHKS